MGNGIGKLTACFTGGGTTTTLHRQKHTNFSISDPLDDLGHSFCYVPTRLSFSSKIHSEEETTTFPSISGASISANTSTPPSTSLLDLQNTTTFECASSTFESSTSFTSIPLQVIPKNPLGHGLMSGQLDNRGFMSGPIERGVLSGPLDNRALFSGPMELNSFNQFQRSLSQHGSYSYDALRNRLKKGSLIRVLKRAISRTRGQNSIVMPIKTVKESDWIVGFEKQNELTISSSVNFSSEYSLDDNDYDDSLENLQWAQGKAGEDRVHVVVSEEHGWVFVGIYDGFNGPDAPDYLLSNLYSAVHKEVKGLLWDDKFDASKSISSVSVENPNFETLNSRISCDNDENERNDKNLGECSRCIEQENYPCGSFGDDNNFDLGNMQKRKGNNKNPKSKYRGGGGAAKKWEENQRKWRCEWDRERLELDRRLKEQFNRKMNNDLGTINHSDVLKSLSQALNRTEEGYLDITDKMVMENPELALMGSCVLVMLMKGEDVYVMNVGDSRAVLAQKKEPDLWSQDLERINEETLHDLEGCDVDRSSTIPNLTALQLSMDHSTSVEEEVQRIRREHLEDACAVMNDRVKGSLKITRAFGAGFLKQPKWNNALVEMFRIDYIGTSPYLTCLPSLYHHKLGQRDMFLILSSDGLYQYFTNEEAVAEVELFMSLSPEGDPAQRLVEEVLFRAAKKAGMEFHELLEIPQGDRRRYHDDVSIIVISLEGRIWRSCV